MICRQSFDIDMLNLFQITEQLDTDYAVIQDMANYPGPCPLILELRTEAFNSSSLAPGWSGASENLPP